jgi:hypothetical protein
MTSRAVQFCHEKVATFNDMFVWILRKEKLIKIEHISVIDRFSLQGMRMRGADPQSH